MDRIALRETGSGPEVSGLIHGLPGNREPFRVWFRFPGLPPEHIALNGNPFVAALLAVAMWLRRPIEIDAPVSGQLLSGASQIMNIWSGWERRLRPIEIRAQALRETHSPGRGSGCFFTAGVDSFHTVLKNLSTETGSSRITHLLFLSGQPDMPLENETGFNRRRADIAEVARELGLAAIFGATNVRDIVPGMTLSWAVRAASNLAAPGLCLSPLLERAIFSTGLAFDAWYRWGNDPLTDPLWSTEQIRFENHGYETTRARKVELTIRESSVALRHLRVCAVGEFTGDNCGRCEKCLRTMISLRAAGVLERCTTLPHEIPLHAVKGFNAFSAITRGFIAENLDALDRSGADPELANVLRQLLRPHPWPRRQFQIAQAAYRLDRNLFGGRMRLWVLHRARAAGTGVELAENPASWLFAQILRKRNGQDKGAGN